MSETKGVELNANGKPVYGSSGRKIVYDKDGKPLAMPGAPKKVSAGAIGAGVAVGAGATAVAAKKPSKECPPDVEQLGRSSWTLLHSIAATYPENPSTKEQADLKQFVSLFGNFYPCWFCRDDFVKYTTVNQPKVKTQEEFGKWLCDAHNEVNTKLGKPKFDCNLWKQRWKDGYKDGSCD